MTKSARLSGISVFLRSAYYEFLDRVRRIVLQESADVVVGIVAAVHRKLDVQTGTATEGNRGDSRFGGVGGFDWLGARYEVGDICEAAVAERYVLQIFG